MNKPLKWRNSSYLERIDLLPPILTWILARRDRMPIMIGEISEKSGVSESHLSHIFSLHSWATIPLGQVDSIRAACGIFPWNERRHHFFLKRALFCGKGLLHHRKRPSPARLRTAGFLEDPVFTAELARRYREYGLIDPVAGKERLRAPMKHRVKKAVAAEVSEAEASVP